MPLELTVQEHFRRSVIFMLPGFLHTERQRPEQTVLSLPFIEPVTINAANRPMPMEISRLPPYGTPLGEGPPHHTVFLPLAV